MIQYPKDPEFTMADFQRMIQKIQLNATYGSSQWVNVRKEKIKLHFTFRRGNPAGYTDDLGIIADENQWIPAQPSGWQSDVDPQDYNAMREWCEQNLKRGDWYTGIYHIFLKNEKDVAWFMLRWS